MHQQNPPRFPKTSEPGRVFWSLARQELFEKLDVANITEAIAFATNYGLL